MFLFIKIYLKVILFLFSFFNFYFSWWLINNWSTYSWNLWLSFLITWSLWLLGATMTILNIGYSSYNLNLPNLISLKIHFPSTRFGSWKWSRTSNILIYLVFHSLNNILLLFFLMTLVTILLITTCLQGHCLWWRWKRN